MLPQGPVLDAETRGAFVERPSSIMYSGEPQVAFPVIPVVVWGAAYDLDLVLVSTHPEWNMHEYARMQTADGPVWFAKDARESTLSQSVVADLEGIERWFPELPVERKGSPVQVTDRSTPDWLDLDLQYENIDGDWVEVTYRGKPPTSAQGKRNGSTMGHSRDLLLAVLDLPYRNFGRSASMRIGGEDVRIKRIAGLLPFRMALVQTQGGLASGHLRQEPPHRGDPIGSAPPDEVVPIAALPTPPEAPTPIFDTVHRMPGGADVRLAWEVEEEGERLLARQISPHRTLVYTFLVGPQGERELVRAHVEQFGREEPVTNLVFTPALPDLARRFEGRRRSRFAVDINGQQGHAVGWVDAYWNTSGPVVEVLPEAPWWTTDRPLRGQLVFDGPAVSLDIEVNRPETP